MTNIVETWYAKGRGANSEFAAKFAKEIPPDTDVYENGEKAHYGTTFSAVDRGVLVTGIYGSASNPFVKVVNVDGVPNTQADWIAEQVVKIT